LERQPHKVAVRLCAAALKLKKNKLLEVEGQHVRHCPIYLATPTGPIQHKTPILILGTTDLLCNERRAVSLRTANEARRMRGRQVVQRLVARVNQLCSQSLADASSASRDRLLLLLLLPLSWLRQRTKISLRQALQALRMTAC